MKHGTKRDQAITLGGRQMAGDGLKLGVLRVTELGEVLFM